MLRVHIRRNGELDREVWTVESLGKICCMEDLNRSEVMSRERVVIFGIGVDIWVGQLILEEGVES